MRAQRIQFLEKYAALAEDLLIKNGEKYTSSDVEKVAEFLINMDLKRADNLEHVENIVKQAQHQARGFASELDEVLGEGAFKKLAGRQKANFLIKPLQKLVGKSKIGKKAVSAFDKGERNARYYLKKQPTMAAGMFAGGVATGALLSD